MKELFLTLTVLSVILTAACSTTECASTKVSGSRDCSWPAVQPMKESYHFVDHQNMGTRFHIKGVDGKSLYLLECYINAYDQSLQERNFDYSGDFECRLTALYGERECKEYRTLLTDNREAIRDWDSRGVFMIEEMSGNCASYPEYGRLRHFKLRGMDFTLEVKDFQLAQTQTRIKELDFEVTVSPDDRARSEIAEPTGYAKPPAVNDCKWTWPVVQPVKKSFHFVDHGGAKVEILGTDGAPLYLLQCYLVSDDIEDPNFNYSCTFACRLTSFYSQDQYSSLLTEEKIQTTDSDRARFCIYPDKGQWCPDYPEWGKVRHLKLRGMNIAIEVKNLQMGASGEGVKELDFEVTVTPDPTAITEIAEPTEYDYPPRAHPEDPNDYSLNCERVLLRDIEACE